MALVDKEVSVIRLKLVKVIHIKLESSFISSKSNQRSTKELITLLKALNESKLNIDSTLLLSRAKFMKDCL